MLERRNRTEKMKGRSRRKRTEETKGRSGEEVDHGAHALVEIRQS